MPSAFISDFLMCIAERKKKENKINSSLQFADNVLLNFKELEVLFLLDVSF